jgi:hypothetical protein
MKMIAEYLDYALKFEQMAAEESDPKLKAQFASMRNLRPAKFLVLPGKQRR